MIPVDLDAARKTAREAQGRATKSIAILEETSTEEAENASYDEAVTAAHEFSQIVDDLAARIIPDLAALVLAMAEEIEHLRASGGRREQSNEVICGDLGPPSDRRGE